MEPVLAPTNLDSLLAFSWKDFSSNRLKAIVSLVSVSIAVASSVFFFSLSEGAKQVTFAKLEQSLSFNEIEVRPQFGVTMFRVTKEEIAPLNEEIKERILALPGVESVFEQLQVTYLSSLEINLYNSQFESDVPIYGIADAALEKQYHGDFTYETYQDAAYVPVLVSRDLVDLYNSGFADAIGKPKLNEEILLDMEFHFRLGYSSFFQTEKENSRRVPARIVGFSERVPLMGITIPAGFVEQYNEEFLGADADRTFSELLVRVADSGRVEEIATTIESWNFNAISLQDKIKGVSDNLNYLMYVMGMVSLLIVCISSLNVLSTIYSAVTEKTKIIGTLRALGATRLQVIMIYVLESLYIGLLGGVIGVVVGAGGAWLLNVLLLQQLPFFSVAGVQLVYMGPEVIFLGLLGSVIFTVLAGLYPAIQAGRLSPKVALQR